MNLILNCRSCARRGHCASATWTHRWMFDHSCSGSQTGRAQVREVTLLIGDRLLTLITAFSFMTIFPFFLQICPFRGRLGISSGSIFMEARNVTCCVGVPSASLQMTVESRFPLCLSVCVSNRLFAGGAVATLTGVSRSVFGTLPPDHTWDWLLIRDYSWWKEREPMLKVQHSPSVHQRLDNIISKLSINHIIINK